MCNPVEALATSECLLRETQRAVVKLKAQLEQERQTVMHQQKRLNALRDAMAHAKAWLNIRGAEDTTGGAERLRNLLDAYEERSR